MNREQIVKDTAYAIWEAEGKPDGRAEEHWRQAEARVAASLTAGAQAAAKPAKLKVALPAKGKATGVSKAAAAKPPAKAAAAKKAPAKTKVEPTRTLKKKA